MRSVAVSLCLAPSLDLFFHRVSGCLSTSLPLDLPGELLSVTAGSPSLQGESYNKSAFCGSREFLVCVFVSCQFTLLEEKLAFPVPLTFITSSYYFSTYRADIDEIQLNIH